MASPRAGSPAPRGFARRGNRIEAARLERVPRPHSLQPASLSLTVQLSQKERPPFAGAAAEAPDAPRWTRGPGARRVLIIEDEPEVAETLATWLEMENYEVRTVGDGASGLAESVNFDPHFVLLDIRLPLMQGTEVARHLRLNEEGVRRVIVATTGLPGITASTAPWDHLLPKPIDLQRLVAVLEQEWRDRFEVA
ncbi:response regulator [Aquincola sp. MAHUQ-54]|uniref:Response regulator n=1 Tax=Aquincola agrisoli TaxID=3119538 RepID=A0AAW9QPR9_9BURK